MNRWRSSTWASAVASTSRLVASEGVDFRAVNASALRVRSPLRFAKGLADLVLGARQARGHLRTLPSAGRLRDRRLRQRSRRHRCPQPEAAAPRLPAGRPSRLGCPPDDASGDPRRRNDRSLTPLSAEGQDGRFRLSGRGPPSSRQQRKRDSVALASTPRVRTLLGKRR